MQVRRAARGGGGGAPHGRKSRGGSGALVARCSKVHAAASLSGVAYQSTDPPAAAGASSLALPPALSPAQPPAQLPARPPALPPRPHTPPPAGPSPPGMTECWRPAGEDGQHLNLVCLQTSHTRQQLQPLNKLLKAIQTTHLAGQQRSNAVLPHGWPPGIWVKAVSHVQLQCSLRILCLKLSSVGAGLHARLLQAALAAGGGCHDAATTRRRT